MLHLENKTKYPDRSSFRRILSKALPILNKQNFQYRSNINCLNNNVHPLNRLLKKKRKRKRRQNRLPLRLFSNPTVIYCSCYNDNLSVQRPCQSFPLNSLKVCVSEGHRLLSGSSRTPKSVLRVKETHEIAEAQMRKNEMLREAFGISEYFVEGSSFDPERHVREAAAKTAIEETKKYALIPSPPSSEDETPALKEHVELSSKSKKKKKKTTRSSSSPSSAHMKKKKKKKHKRKSASLSHDEKVSNRKSKSEKENKKTRQISLSPMESKHRKKNNDSSDAERKKNKKKKAEKHCEGRQHKSRISHSPSPFASDVDVTSNRDGHKNKKKRSSSPKIDEKKKQFSSKARVRKNERVGSLTPDTSLEREKKFDYRDTNKKHSLIKHKERHKSEKLDNSEHHRSKRERSSCRDSKIHSKRKLSPADNDRGDYRNSKYSNRRELSPDESERKNHSQKKSSHKRKSSSSDSERGDYRDTKIPDKMSSKIVIKERNRNKMEASDRRYDHRSPSEERRKNDPRFSSQSSSKRKRRDSSSEKEYSDKKSRHVDSSEKYYRDKEYNREKYLKPFYGKKTRLTVSNSESDRSSTSPEKPKQKPKLVSKVSKVIADVDRRVKDSASKTKNYSEIRPDLDSDRSSETESFRNSRKDRHIREKVLNEKSKTFKSLSFCDKLKNVGDKLENDKESFKSDKLEISSEIVIKAATSNKNNDDKFSKSVTNIQHHSSQTGTIAENGTIESNSKINNRDGSTSSSLSYSPMEKYPHRYEDILSDVSRKNQKSEPSRKSEIKEKNVPVKSDERLKRDEEFKFSSREKSSFTQKSAAPITSEMKFSDTISLNDVPLPPDSCLSASRLPPKKYVSENDAEKNSSNKPLKVMSDSSFNLAKSIPPSLSQKPNTLASSISDVLTKSLKNRAERPSSPSCSDSSSKQKSRSSSRSSSSSDSSRDSDRHSNSDSSSSSSDSSSQRSTRRRSRKSSSSDRSSSSTSSDSSRSRSRSRVANKKKKKRQRSLSDSDSRSDSSSCSSGRSRSNSIPRRKGSPSFLERRRITSRKRMKDSSSSSSSSSRSSSASSSSGSSSYSSSSS